MLNIVLIMWHLSLIWLARFICMVWSCVRFLHFDWLSVVTCIICAWGLCVWHLSILELLHESQNHRKLIWINWKDFLGHYGFVSTVSVCLSTCYIHVSLIFASYCWKIFVLEDDFFGIVKPCIQHEDHKYQFHDGSRTFQHYISRAMRKHVLCHMRTTKAQISLRTCAVWSAPVMMAA